ncbi:MAG TPA: hypothetical protein VGG98_01950 [Solirubrobacteraceae bacterium]|jgi:hypothetical protein
MASKGEISEQVARESERRARLAVPAFAGGVIYLLSAIVISSTLNGAPTVGLLQGLGPALSGVADPPVSPRAAEVKFISHHGFALIAGSTLAAVAIGALTLILLLLIDATRFRRPQTWAASRPLVLAGGIGVAVVSLGHQIVSAIETHNFAVGHDFSSSAVDHALTKGTANVITDYLDLLAGLALAVGMISVMINAMRVGLLTRWVGIVGIFAGVLVFLPLGGAELEVVPAFWMVAIGILFVGKWPNGEPPAWASGEARPWPSQAELRAAKQAASGGQAGGNGTAPSTGTDVVPAPTPSRRSSRRRSRKPGSRR